LSHFLSPGSLGFRFSNFTPLSIDELKVTVPELETVSAADQGNLLTPISATRRASGIQISRRESGVGIDVQRNASGYKLGATSKESITISRNFSNVKDLGITLARRASNSSMPNIFQAVAPPR
jgi:hypothetical protein